MLSETGSPQKRSLAGEGSGMRNLQKENTGECMQDTGFL